MKKFTALFVFLFMIGTGSAMAGIISIGPPLPSNSWAQQWLENGILQGIFQPYNRIEITITLGGMEFVTALTPSWSVTNDASAGASFGFSGTGGHIGEFQFITTFEGYSTSPVAFLYQVYYNDALLSTQLAAWNPDSAQWSYDYPQNCVRPVPEPDIAILLLCAAGCMVIGFRKHILQ